MQSRLSAERPLLADQLIARCQTEGAELRIEILEIRPAQGVGEHILSYNPRATGEILDAAAEARILATPLVRDNGAAVRARGLALHALGEEVREWTAKGAYGTEAELRRMFDAAYRALPQVEVAAAA